MATLTAKATAALTRWAQAMERHWLPLAHAPELGCYGSGYVHWGVQSNWNYAATLATLADQPGVTHAAHFRDRALAALRFALATHVTGDRRGFDGQSWGHSWISMLGIERAMHGIARLEPSLHPEDRAALRRVLTAEADWALHHAHRGDQAGVVAGLWNSSGRNVPESNIWTGALLWRTAQLYPDAPAADAWRARAHDYFINGVSVPADALDTAQMAGRSIAERHVGANFFPNYALDHHGYLNVGYMVICVSNVAMLHFDMRHAGLARPETLDHHQAELWALVRRMLCEDGRLIRIGGDSRVRYAYCQEYLLPALLYAADWHGDGHALALAEAQVDLMLREADDDGAFYGRRLAQLRAANPHYYTRLESDRACVLAMLLNYLPLVTPPPAPAAPFAAVTAGGWSEPEHGAVFHRGEKRFASFSWRAFGLTQALCLAPTDSSLAEWSANLCPVVRFLGDDGTQPGTHRRLLHYTLAQFDGGFVTCGAVMEGVNVRVDEGAMCTDQAVTHIAFAALPDGRTCVGMHYVIAASDRVGFLAELKGLHLNVPNDLFNDRQRTLVTAAGADVLSAPPAEDEVRRLAGPWVNIDEALGVVLVYDSDGYGGGGSSGDGLTIDRSTRRRGGRYASLYVEEICTSVRGQISRVRPGQVLIDTGFVVRTATTAAATAAIEAHMVEANVTSTAQPAVRTLAVTGADGRSYIVAANFGTEPTAVEWSGRAVTLAPDVAVVLRDGVPLHMSQPA